jgi:outer membrane biosynthesis protein TonB
MQKSNCNVHKVDGRNARTLAVCAWCILTLALLGAGCASKAKAESLADGPPLAVPIPPVHEIAIEQIAEAPQAEPQPEPPPAATVTQPPRVTRPPARQEPRETPAPAAAQPPPPPPAATAEAPAVRAAPSSTAGDEKKIRELLTQATNDLNTRVDYKRLSNDGKAQYDQSKRFSDEAYQAIKERNLVLALTLAEKAAILAAALVR